MQASWYFDFASPFSYLQLAKMREWRARLLVTPVPIAARALSNTIGENETVALSISGSVSGFVRLRAKTLGIPLRFPSPYPFNSLAALRLCIAAGANWPATEAIFAHLWRDGLAGNLAADLQPVGHALGLADTEAAIGAIETATQLRANTEAAVTIGVSAVPTVRVGSKLFYGSQAAEQLDDWLAHPEAPRLFA
ncbi:MAG: DsbA family protein [Rudaea sp.]|nr:DsbA family protein [Rudaea sp.]